MPDNILKDFQRFLFTINKTDLVLRLTLVAFIFKPIGASNLLPIITLVSSLGLIFPKILKEKFYWLLITIINLAVLIIHWPIADNHSFLLLYWNITILIYIWQDDPEIITFNSRYLIGFVFLFAFLWKAVFQTDFISGEFMRFIVIDDERFRDFTVYILGIDYDTLYNYFRNYHDDYTLFNEYIRNVDIPDRFYAITSLLTYYTITIEFIVASAFLTPFNNILTRNRDYFLMLFCLTVYAVATVEGFAWLLIIMGIAQRPGIDKTSVFYLFTFILIFLYTKYPLFAVF